MPDSDAAHASLAPVEEIARVESLGRRATTPCGAGGWMQYEAADRLNALMLEMLGGVG